MFTTTPHRYATLPFACTRVGPGSERSALLLSDEKRSLELDTSTGKHTLRKRSFAPSARRFTSVDAAARIEERSHLAEMFVARDEGGRCVFNVINPKQRLQMTVDSTATLYGYERFCVCTTRSAAHFVVIDERSSSISSVSIALPLAEERDSMMHGEFVWILAGRTLLAISVEALSFDQERVCVALEYAPLFPASARDRRPAVATMLLQNKLLLDHPGFGRLTLDRTPSDPPLEKGERVSLDEVVEVFPGVFRVLSWSRWTEAHERAEAPVALSLDAPPSAQWIEP